MHDAVLEKTDAWHSFCTVLRSAGADPGFNKGGCLNGVIMYSGKATVTAAKQPWGVGAGGGFARKLEHLRYHKTQETM